MGKEQRNKNYKHKNHKPYKKDGWKNHRNGGGNRNDDGAHKPFDRKLKQNVVPRINLREDQVGITEYVNDGVGFTGVLKSRYSDFHVNEIDKNGKILQLTDLNIPQLVDDSLNAEELAAAREEINDVITTEVWEKIEMLASAKSEQKNEQAIEIDVGSLDKDKRTQIHKVIKKLYEGKLVSTTASSKEASAAEQVERKFIKIMKPKGGRDQNRNRWTFPGEYVHFLVHKENMDTSEAAAAMADRLNLRPSQVNYCGTKDKRAKTTQKFCIKRRTPKQIVGSVKALNNVFVGNFEFSNEVLKLGDLKGNRFRIALRHVSGDQPQIEVALKQLRDTGFINYFGLQRFGNCASIPTYDVGVAMLKCDYKLACELILKPRDNDIHFMRAIRETWWKDRNSAAAAAMFRGDKFIEKKLLNGLAQYGESDYASALRKIPRNMLLLYPHAFQSLIYNRIASRRIKEFGLKLMPGDLVYRNRDELDMDLTDVADDAVDEDEEVKPADESTTENTDADSIAEESIFKRKVKSLTAEDIASGTYTLFDVVLPLPGYDIKYPDNEVGEWYEQLLEEYGLSSEKLRHNVKTYAMAGAYRKMFIQPTQMSWEFRNYDNAESLLITSDWEQLKVKKSVEISPNEGKFTALLLDFCLPTAVYATMMLRELLKSDTSAANQNQLELSELNKVNIEKLENKDSVSEIESDGVVEKRKSDNLDDDEEAAAAKKVKSSENLDSTAMKQV